MSLLTLKRSLSIETSDISTPTLHRSKSDNDLLNNPTVLEDIKTFGSPVEDKEKRKRENRDLQGYIVSPYSAFSLLLFEKEQIKPHSAPYDKLSLDLQNMINMIRPIDDLKMAIRLDYKGENLRLYLGLIMSENKLQSALIGFTFLQNSKPVQISIVIPTRKIYGIIMTGDGGFKVCCHGERGYLFYPLSLKSLWSSLQIIYDIVAKLPKNIKNIKNTNTYFDYYIQKISIDPDILLPWNISVDLSSTVSMFSTKNEDKSEIHKQITVLIRQIILTENVETLSMHEIRKSLENRLRISLDKYSSYIDNEAMRIFGQMDVCSKINEYIYLGSEWNAADRDSLHRLGVTHILNVTKEIDNFYPGIFEYMNIPVEDIPEEDIMCYFDSCYQFIEKARTKCQKVLIHCQMGVSRSATIVLSYLMKYYGWNVAISLDFVKVRRSIVNPNPGFYKQLLIYEGILNSSRNREIFSLVSQKNNHNLNGIIARNGSFSLITPNSTFIKDSNRNNLVAPIKENAHSKSHSNSNMSK